MRRIGSTYRQRLYLTFGAYAFYRPLERLDQMRKVDLYIYFQTSVRHADLGIICDHANCEITFTLRPPPPLQTTTYP